MPRWAARAALDSMSAFVLPASWLWCLSSHSLAEAGLQGTERCRLKPAESLFAVSARILVCFRVDRQRMQLRRVWGPPLTLFYACAALSGPPCCGACPMALPPSSRGDKTTRSNESCFQTNLVFEGENSQKSICNGDFRFVGILACGRVLR